MLTKGVRNMIMSKMQLKETLKSIDPKEFDGHTEFYRLSLDQKLVWIMQISLFIFEVCNAIIKDQNFIFNA
jgi:hypothetical protein